MSLLFLTISYVALNSAQYTITGKLDNITNPEVNKHVFGVNFFNGDPSANYTLCRDGGEGTTRFNWEIGAYNSARDWYFIGQGGSTWQETLDPCIAAGQDVLTQIPAMGWVAKS
eukprot:CAMPEP_0201572598 /NCGR_PEP_ID=MMETSP0190_2-20130828/15971_1 /ASSEMBLY_ACC=CAM_ASM_000263 /TAXON_ID=37353 /ORGANISM="Rosalina sp." /LENGTH=113 /DNA_ID=CAMNT_0047998573 /DNA_START=28 /DNA_END=365 /DNA_ORIENTATION=-